MEENNEGLIYFIEAEGQRRVKIGYTSSIERRIPTLKTSSPFKLKLLFSLGGTRKDEQELHKRFTHLRTNGEWFRLDSEILWHIETLKGGSKTCTALTHLLTPTGRLTYYCCINAGVPKWHLAGVRCTEQCSCHEMEEGWRPGR